jgi:hypothetical protein
VTRYQDRMIRAKICCRANASQAASYRVFGGIKVGKAIKERISDSFTGDNSAAEARAYSDKVYAAWKDVSSSLSRNAVLIFLLIAAFELIVSQKESSAFVISSFAFTNVPLIQIVLPIIVVILVYDGWRLTKRYLDLQQAYLYLFEEYAINLRQNELDVLIRPIMPAFWSIGISSSEVTGQTSDKFISNVGVVLALVAAWVFPIAFETQAYYRLFDKFGYHDIILWSSMFITALLTICTVVYVIMLFRESQH